MAGLIEYSDYNELVVNICYDNTNGEIIVLDNLPIQLPKLPNKKDILFHDKPQKEQMWKRLEVPKELEKIKSEDEFYELPLDFREKYMPYIVKEFERRKKGVWFYNNGEPTYITGAHYMFLQWSKIDVGYPNYFAFQRLIFIHQEACVADPRCFGQIYTKCRRSGYTNLTAARLVSDATIAKEKLLGIQSKTGADAQENVFMKKVVPIYQSYPFFFKPIQDGTTNPRMELAFREPAKRITAKNKTSTRGDALNTIINHKNTTNGAYDGEKLYRLFLDESAKYVKPADLVEMWRIERTCLIVGRKIIGKAWLGSTINPLDQGGREYVKIVADSDLTDRNENGTTKTGLYSLFTPAYDALEGYFDQYGNCIADDPEKPIMGIDGEWITHGSKTFLRNIRKSLENDPRELNEHIRQFPWTLQEACRDSVEGSTFNLGKIYQQVEFNSMFNANPITRGNFYWKNGIRDTVVEFSPSETGRFYISWMPDAKHSNQKEYDKSGKPKPVNGHIGRGGVDSYDIDATVDKRSSKGALHFYHGNHVVEGVPSNTFVLEYAERPPKAMDFYEDVLMAAIYYSYPLLIENNKRRIIQVFEERGYENYMMRRPSFLQPKGTRYQTDDYGVPSNSADVADQHAQAIEAYIEEHCGNKADGGVGTMYFNRTLEDWAKFKINDRTKYDLTISSGYAILATQTRKKEEVKQADFSGIQFFRKYKFNA